MGRPPLGTEGESGRRFRVKQRSLLGGTGRRAQAEASKEEQGPASFQWIQVRESNQPQ